jgi:putative methionine-R-sulfoxide reductase with GAF domain
MTQQQTRPEVKAAAKWLPLADWLPEIAPTLRVFWTDYVAEFSTKPFPPPNLTDWLTLLHVAETTPVKISYHLTQLLRHPKNGTELQEGWVTLTQMFALTFAALQSQANHISPEAWRSLVTLQNKVMTTAATSVLVRPNRPSTDILTRRANYLQTITDINKKIVAIRDTEELLSRLVGLIQQAFGYQYITLFLCKPNESSLSLHSTAWQNHQDELKSRPSLDVETSQVTTQAATTREVVWINDLTQAVDIAPHPLLPEAQAQISLPLVADNRLLGVLEIVDSHPQAFTQDDRQILVGLANHIAIAIKNVRLQDIFQRHLREQTLIYESNVALGTSLDVDSILQLAAQAMAEMLEVRPWPKCWRSGPALSAKLMSKPGPLPHLSSILCLTLTSPPLPTAN